MGTEPTDFGSTGQRRDVTTAGLMYYGARYYDTTLGRSISADSIVLEAGAPQAFNRNSSPGLRAALDRSDLTERCIARILA